jgi:hypothetical protein
MKRETIVAHICALIEDHCLSPNEREDRSADIISPGTGERANIDAIVSFGDGRIRLELDDGSRWSIIVEERT